MPTRHGASFWKNAKTYRRFNCRRMITLSSASMPWTWNTDLAISRPIVVIACMIGSSKLWGPYQHPHSWHSRAGGGAVHSIISGLMHRSKAEDVQRGNSAIGRHGSDG